MFLLDLLLDGQFQVLPVGLALLRGVQVLEDLELQIHQLIVPEMTTVNEKFPI